MSELRIFHASDSHESIFLQVLLLKDLPLPKECYTGT